ncbi:MAG: MobP3 family relaxase [Bacillota bacterium]
MKEVGNRETGPSWRLVLSLREDDARELGITNLAAWQDLTRRSMAQFAKATGTTHEHLKWIAAHHPEHGHPHVHVIAWLADSTPRRAGLLSPAELRDVRRGVAKEIFGPLRTRLAGERTIARDTMLEAGKQNVARAERILLRIELEAQVADPVGERLPPRFFKQDLEALAEKIEALTDIMPGKGQAKLAYMPAQVKEEARTITGWILSRPQIAEFSRIPAGGG